MAIIKGKYYYKGIREYKYEITVLDVENLKTLDFNIQVTNPHGKTVSISWNFRHKGIEESIREYIELVARKKRKITLQNGI